MMSSFPFFVLLCSSRLMMSGYAYSVEEIRSDSKSMSWESFVQYRGDILSDIWIKGDDDTPRKNHKICQKLFEKAIEPVDIQWPPPKSPPNDTESLYTMGGASKLQLFWTAEKQNGGDGYQWNKDVFQGFMNKATIGCGFYPEKYCDQFVSTHQQFVRNKTAIVVGSQTPWAETTLFKNGAKHVTTIEYMKITSDYPNFSSLLPSEVASKYLKHQWSHVDFAFSYSSLEHDGLGRYGDPLNPYGDLESLARIRCLLKPGGILFLAVPVSPDTIVWNLHRTYGRKRLNLLLLGWNALEIYPTSCNVDNPAHHGSWKCQPLIVLQKPHLTHPVKHQSP